MSHHNRAIRAGLTLTALAILAGCASDNKTAAKKKGTDEYVYYTPTGSNIPVKVKKQDLAEANQELSGISQEALRQMQMDQRIGTTMKDGGK